jgi:hypothetical protein
MLFFRIGVKGAWQKIGHMKFLALAARFANTIVGAARKLPDDLATRATRRRQCLSVSDHGKLRKLRSPSDNAFQIATRSAQTVKP